MSNAQGVEGVSNGSPDTQNTQIDYNRSASARIPRRQKFFQENSVRGEPLGCWIVYRFAVVTGSTAV